MNEPGTLMWIGERYSREFADAFAFCEASVAQLAVRSTLQDVVKRPAVAVNRIIVTQPTRSPLETFALQSAVRRYAGAELMKLQGSLCEGMRTPSEPEVDRTHYWHQWSQVLPTWLTCCGVQQTSEETSRSVAVVAENLNQGEALLDVAAAAGVTALWCPGGKAHLVRNVDTVWWDDSVAKPANRQVWSNRIAQFQSSGGTNHVWITSAPRTQHIDEASHGGIHSVISKPMRIDVLMSSLGKSRLNPASLARVA